MTRHKSLLVPLVSAVVLTASLAAVQPAAVAEPQRTAATDYIVLMKGSTVDAAARRAIARAGGTITREDSRIGYAYVRSTSATFAAAVAGSSELAGAARERVIGRAPAERRARTADLERMTAERRSSAHEATVSDAPASPTAEPLANLQWDMRQIGATATGSYAKNQGSKAVKVGIIDTGVDGTHPDIAPNFDVALSHNFVTDMPDIDGPCEYASCVDPADEDDNEHGTHVASTIGSPINGLGIAGVAPNVDLVSIRAGQDSGYFFLQPTLQAIEYAGIVGVDVINMSFYTDPWLYNCTNNPADSPAEQAEQRVIRTATQRALNFAVNRGVLPVAALGNEATDLNNPTDDPTSPDYPADAAKDRTVDNSCISVPTESKGVVSVSSTGISTRKAYYSNWGTQETDVAAPGGDAYDTPGNTRALPATVLAAFPESLARLNGDLNADGTPNNPGVVRDCKGTVCAYYQYLQGTSMASPHAAGVAALIVSAHGVADKVHGGLTLAPAKTTALLYRTAVPTACPSPRTFHYTRITPTGAVVQSDATCSGGIAKNGFYGHGIVNAYNAVR